jgi:hypothetical protein
VKNLKGRRTIAVAKAAFSHEIGLKWRLYGPSLQVKA